MTTNQKKKILVADDDKAILDAIKIMLEISGYEVCTEADGEIIKKLKKEKPQLLLLDIWMSGVDGREVCKKIKSDHEISDIPVILISASKDIKGSYQISGADDYLEKPFEMETLLSKIERYTR
jgi:CheY-like chemotaxis protein